MPPQTQRQTRVMVIVLCLGLVAGAVAVSRLVTTPPNEEVVRDFLQSAALAHPLPTSRIFRYRNKFALGNANEAAYAQQELLDWNSGTNSGTNMIFTFQLEPPVVK